ncbi:MAG: hypothetical protein H7X95_12215, partial [Deltaproteobacteria bacterium]|nr:hypothetical protein [Deltaproteobacteria bacterium]
KLRPVAGTRDQLRVVRQLLCDRRFSEVVNGCDAGREGELIFRYVYELAGSRLPIRRLWISSLTDESIRQGFAALRPGATYDALGDAARCRSEADWLVGMNATRAVTIQSRGSADTGTRGSRGARTRAPAPPVYSIGRVQTPTLAILVRREQAIRAFEPRDYWEVRGTFDADNSEPFTALWTLRSGPDKGKPKDNGKDNGSCSRFGDRDLANQVVTRLAAHGSTDDPSGPIVETLIQKQTREPPPQLFDLTSLQRTANRRYGFSATRTLQAAQALYERHKLLTYPRTDSRHLPQELLGEVPKLFAGLAKIPTYAPFATSLLGGDILPAARSRRVFDAAKVHDHHAIIPTGKVPGGTISPDEQRIFDLVARRFLGAFYPDAEFALTEAVIRVGPSIPPTGAPVLSAASGPPVPKTDGKPLRESGTDPSETLLTMLPPAPDRFIARGRVRLAAGWQAVAGFDDPGRPLVGGGEKSADAPKHNKDNPDSLLPPLTQGQRLNGRFQTVAHQTRPPPRHTEATLLGAMESAGREIEDEALRAAMKETGLGTPATRASTIETLVKRGFIARDGKQVAPTPTGIGLIERLPVPTLASPELTGAWEARLVRIARGQESRAAFMTDIARYVREVMDAVRGGPSQASVPSDMRKPPARTGTTVPPPAVLELRCPRCREGSIIAGNRGWGCARWREGCPFVIWFNVAGKRVTDAQLRDLVEKGKTRKSKTGRLVLDVGATREQGAARFQPA